MDTLEDPYRTIKRLGQGNSVVWKVELKENPRIVYARKEFVLNHQPSKEDLKAIDNEVEIMKKLEHRHVVKFVMTYRLGENSQSLFLLLDPVAQVSLKKVFERMCRYKADEPGRLEICRDMCKWPACLIQAMDYVHKQGVRHKDIKPSNILIKNERVYLADFGISKDIQNRTTSKTGGQSGRATWRYVAPEIKNEDDRGRATDIFALGCVIIELCTVASGQNTIEDLDQHLRGKSTSSRDPTFADSADVLFQWIWLLLCSPGPDPETASYVQKLLQLAFLMVDFDPFCRVTSEELVDLIATSRNKYFHKIAESACADCQKDLNINGRDVKPHSIFKTEENGDVYIPSITSLPTDEPGKEFWFEAKGRWLTEHKGRARSNLGLGFKV